VRALSLDDVYRYISSRQSPISFCTYTEPASYLGFTQLGAGYEAVTYRTSRVITHGAW
jgi:hypothetical protein